MVSQAETQLPPTLSSPRPAKPSRDGGQRVHWEFPNSLSRAGPSVVTTHPSSSRPLPTPPSPILGSLALTHKAGPRPPSLPVMATV